MQGTLTIISGGQTGADRGALDAALALQQPCGGWCPAGRLAEDGPIAPRYPLEELPGGDYIARTRANVRDSDATLILYFDVLEGGTALTEKFCRALQKPCLRLDGNHWSAEDAAREAAEFIARRQVGRLNVAGPRASKAPQAQDYAFAAISSLLKTAIHSD